MNWKQVLGIVLGIIVVFGIVAMYDPSAKDDEITGAISWGDLFGGKKPTTARETVQVRERLAPSTVEVNDCKDTDGGINKYIAGEIIGSMMAEGMLSQDMCTGTDVREVFCNEDGLGEPRLEACPNGCEEGACLGGATEEFNSACVIVKTTHITPESTLINGNSICEDKGKVCSGVQFFKREIYYDNGEFGFVDSFHGLAEKEHCNKTVGFGAEETTSSGSISDLPGWTIESIIYFNAVLCC